MEMSVSEMMLGGHRYFIGITRDITDRKRAEKKIAHLAHYDYLTDLPNRALFLDVLNHSICSGQTQQAQSGRPVSRSGRVQEDQRCAWARCGRPVAEGSCRKAQGNRSGDSDTVARVGGDEFIIVLDNIDSEDNAALVANKIIVACWSRLKSTGKPVAWEAASAFPCTRRIPRIPNSSSSRRMTPCTWPSKAERIPICSIGM